MICTSIAETDINKCKKILQECPLVELRADRCNYSSLEIEALVSLHSNLIITCRAKWPIYNSTNNKQEYSSGIDKQQALNIITSAIRRGAKYVDVEIEAHPDYLEYIKSYAKANSCKLIISYHNYTETPSKGNLEEIYALCQRKGADMVKIVSYANSIEDSSRVLSLYNSVAKGCNSTPLIAFTMGNKGKFSRLCCLKMGSPFTYCSYKNASTAEGQYSKQEMEQAMLADNYPYMILGGSLCSNNASQSKILGKDIYIPCSKSMSQRAIIAAALAEGETILENFFPCNDSMAALKIIEKLGCRVERIIDKDKSKLKYKSYTLKITGLGAKQLAKNTVNNLDVEESGFLARLLSPIFAYFSHISGKDITINGSGSLLKRELSDAIKAVEALGAKCKATGNSQVPLTISGKINVKEININASKSSQSISGLLFTLPLLEFDTKLSINNAVSIPYIKLSINILRNFGIEIKEVNNANLANNTLVYKIRGNQKYKPCKIALSSDWSTAAYFLVAAALGKDIIICNLDLNSEQADKAILDVLKLCNAKLEFREHNGLVDISPINVSIEPQILQAFDFNATNCPDLFPILAVLAMFCNGTSKIYGLHRLSNKESNRAESIYSQLSALGANLQIEGDSLVINSTQQLNCCSRYKLHGSYLNTYNDHRIAMSLIIASYFIPDPLYLNNIECINKSFLTSYFFNT